MRRGTLVTGFGPFLSVVQNPSGLLAQGCGRPSEMLEVSYACVDEFLRRLRF